MSTPIDVRHLNLTHRDEPIIEYDPENSDGQHVVTLFRGFLENYWPIEDVFPDVRRRLYAEAGQEYAPCPDCGYDPCGCEDACR